MSFIQVTNSVANAARIMEYIPLVQTLGGVTHLGVGVAQVLKGTGDIAARVLRLDSGVAGQGGYLLLHGSLHTIRGAVALTPVLAMLNAVGKEDKAADAVVGSAVTFPLLFGGYDLLKFLIRKAIA